MPNERQPRKKRRHHIRIGHGQPVRVTGPGWVYLNADGKHVMFTEDAQPIDGATLPRLQFPATSTNEPGGAYAASDTTRDDPASIRYRRGHRDRQGHGAGDSAAAGR